MSATITTSAPAAPLPTATIQASLGDNGNIKAVLDAHARDTLEALGHKVNQRYSNIELVVGYTSAVLCAVSHFYPLPFPEIRPVLLVCVCIYAVINAYQWHVFRTEKGEFFVFSGCAAPDGSQVQVRLASDMERFETKYELVVEVSRSSGRAWEVQKKFTRKVEEWFDEDGFLAAPIFENFIKQSVSSALAATATSKSKSQ